jgi:hypothetical protein
MFWTCDGTVVGVTKAAADYGPVNVEFDAWTVQEYWVPLVIPTSVIGDAGPEAVKVVGPAQVTVLSPSSRPGESLDEAARLAAELWSARRQAAGSRSVRRSRWVSPWSGSG